MMVRWTIPRLKFNQVMGMAWNGLIPLSIAILLIVSVMVAKGWTALWQMALMNVVVAAVFVLIAPNIARTTENKKLRIAGSRFSPLVGEEVVTGVANPMARADRPVGA
jgi:NADH-quinone oxidoreductase subunit H